MNKEASVEDKTDKPVQLPYSAEELSRLSDTQHLLITCDVMQAALNIGDAALRRVVGHIPDADEVLLSIPVLLEVTAAVLDEAGSERAELHAELSASCQLLLAEAA